MYIVIRPPSSLNTRTYEGQYKSNASYINHGYILYKVETLFHKVSFIINTLFPPLHEMLYAGHIKLFAEALELFMHTVFQLVVIRKMASLECNLQGTKKMEAGGC